jgi:hypothetical protein
MINIGIGMGWAKAIYSVANNVIANFKARVLSYPNSIFEAGPCLDATLEGLNAKGLLDNASLIITPNAYNTGILYDVVPNTTLGDMNVVRATTATRVNSAGLIEVVPRNLFGYSNDFSNANWEKISTTVAIGQVGYNGTSNAWLLTSTSTPNPYVRQVLTVNVNDTFSIYLKKGTLNWAFILTSGSSTANFDLQNGVVGSLTGCSASIENVGNGWYRCTVTPTTIGTNVRVYPALSNNNTNGLGNIIIQNAQLEQGSTATEYFPTTTRLNIPRIDYTNGSCPSLLVEPQRTNLLTYSEEFNNIDWLKLNSTITTNIAIAPNGTLTADLLVCAGSAAGTNYVRQIKTISATTHTLSFYAKANASSIVRVAEAALTGQQLNYDLSNNTISGSGSQISGTITDYVNGWKKITFTYIYTTGQTNCILNINSLSCYIWGAQLEQGSYATSYIPTVASTVTRNADVISKTGISSLIGQTEGTIFADWYNTTTEGHILTVSGNSNADYFEIVKYLNLIIINVNKNSVAVSGFAQTISLNQRYKIAISYIVNNIKIYVNGVLVFTDTSNTIPITDKINVGSFLFNNSILNDRINSVQIYKTQLSNAECIQLTTL